MVGTPANQPASKQASKASLPDFFVSLFLLHLLVPFCRGCVYFPPFSYHTYYLEHKTSPRGEHCYPLKRHFQSNLAKPREKRRWEKNPKNPGIPKSRLCRLLRLPGRPPSSTPVLFVVCCCLLLRCSVASFAVILLPVRGPTNSRKRDVGERRGGDGGRRNEGVR
jgi:hypothetical protein